MIKYNWCSTAQGNIHSLHIQVVHILYYKSDGNCIPFQCYLLYFCNNKILTACILCIRMTFKRINIYIPKLFINMYHNCELYIIYNEMQTVINKILILRKLLLLLSRFQDLEFCIHHEQMYTFYIRLLNKNITYKVRCSIKIFMHIAMKIC